jgi:hypothetical protein
MTNEKRTFMSITPLGIIELIENLENIGPEIIRLHHPAFYVHLVWSINSKKSNRPVRDNSLSIKS